MMAMAVTMIAAGLLPDECDRAYSVAGGKQHDIGNSAIVWWAMLVGLYNDGHGLSFHCRLLLRFMCLCVGLGLRLPPSPSSARRRRWAMLSARLRPIPRWARRCGWTPTDNTTTSAIPAPPIHWLSSRCWLLTGCDGAVNGRGSRAGTPHTELEINRASGGRNRLLNAMVAELRWRWIGSRLSWGCCIKKIAGQNSTQEPCIPCATRFRRIIDAPPYPISLKRLCLNIPPMQTLRYMVDYQKSGLGDEARQTVQQQYVTDLHVAFSTLENRSLWAKRQLPTVIPATVIRQVGI